MTEEKLRLATHQDDLRGTSQAGTPGRGRSISEGTTAVPGNEASEVGDTVATLLKEVLPEVFDRFAEAAAKVVKKDLETLVTSENLHGLTPVFAQLGLVRDVKGKPVFNTDSGPLAEVYSRIGNQYGYGIASTGKSLADEFADDPYGWEFDMVRLLVSPCATGKIEATSKGATIDSVLSIEARNTFENNNLFRQTSFRPKKGVDFDELIKAAEAFKSAFGKELPELEQGAAAAAIRDEAARHEPGLQEQHSRLLTHRLARYRRAGQGPRATTRDPIGQRGIGRHRVQRLPQRAQGSDQAGRRAPAGPDGAGLARPPSAPARPWISRGPSSRPSPTSPTMSATPPCGWRTLSSGNRSSASCRPSTSSPVSSRTPMANGTARPGRAGRCLWRGPQDPESTPGWHELDEDPRRAIAGPLDQPGPGDPEQGRSLSRSSGPTSMPARRGSIGPWRSSCKSRKGHGWSRSAPGPTSRAGSRARNSSNASLDALRDACLHHLGAGKKVLIQ